VHDLAGAIIAVDDSVTQADARQLVDDLIDVQLLLSDFELPLSSLDSADDAVGLLRSHGLTDLALVLERSAAALQTISEGALGTSVDSYREIAAELQATTGIDSSSTFNAKLVRSGTPEVGPEVLAEIDRAVALLHRIAAPETTPLQSFAEEFSLRFGTREVPLLEALDPDTGIAFPPLVPDSSPLIDGLPFHASSGNERPDRWLDRDHVLLNQRGAAATARHVRRPVRDCRAKRGRRAQRRLPPDRRRNGRPLGGASVHSLLRYGSGSARARSAAHRRRGALPPRRSVRRSASPSRGASRGHGRTSPRPPP
jgi:hypothetical protein